MNLYVQLNVESLKKNEYITFILFIPNYLTIHKSMITLHTHTTLLDCI